ncbi:MAG: methyltransferase domain-containing protein [Pseudomonadota bacterium]
MIDIGQQMAAVLDALGLDRVHLVGWGSADWGPTVSGYADRISSLTLAFPALRLGTPDQIEPPVLGFTSDQGNGPVNAARLRSRATALREVEFAGYNAALWNDVIADNAATMESSMRAFFAEHPIPGVVMRAQDGQVGEIRYTVRGEGPPLVVLPIGLVPGQWDAVTGSLADAFTIVTLGGAPLGMVATLESRAESGYGKVVRTLLDELEPKPADRVLEVGCGPGSLLRELATRHQFDQPLRGADINNYLMDEARALNASAGLAERIEITHGNAEALPFEDGEFDLLYCSTVLEEGHADAMLGEFLRVLRPGGRLAVAVRSMDMPWWVNITGNDTLRSQLNSLAPRTSSGAGPGGCADASLYARVTRAGFQQVRMRPQLAIYCADARCLEVRERLLAMLTGDEAAEFSELATAAESAGTFFVAEPFHGATARR